MMKIFSSVMNAFWGTKNADPAIMPAKAILKMATANGARMRCFKGGLPGGFDIHQLPMLYTGALGFDVTYSLALSFLAFLISGLIGSFNYYKVGNLDVKMSAKLGLWCHWRRIFTGADRKINCQDYFVPCGTFLRHFHIDPYYKRIS